MPEPLQPCVIVRWYYKDGPERLRAAIASLPERQGAPTAPVFSLAAKEGELTALLRARVARATAFDSTAPRIDLPLRAAIFEQVLEVRAKYEAQQFQSVSDGIAALDAAGHWLPLTDIGLQNDPTLLGATIRIRRAWFVAEVNLVNSGAWERTNRSAHSILAELVALEPKLLNPAPNAGWSFDDCRAATRDLLDTFVAAKEWFRGWSPDLLHSLCGVPIPCSYPSAWLGVPRNSPS